MNRKRQISLMTLAIVTALTGCAVGPDYKGAPQVDAGTAFKEAAGFKPANPQELTPRGKWWEAYGDPTLNGLMEQVQISNQNVKQFEAQYRQAQAAGDVARAAFWPTAGLDLSAGRSQSNTSTVSGTGGAGATTSNRTAIKNNYGTVLDASWEPDIWGKVRRQVEAQDASTQASAANLAGALLSAQATLAQDYFQLRVLDGQKALYVQTVAAYQKSLNLTQNQYKAGIVTRADVAQAQTQLYAAQASLTDLGVSRAQLEHAIAILIGKAPSNFTLPEETLAANLPGIPAGLPSQLLERRPDIAAAERAVAQANANVGVATAAMYPALTLSATGGYQGNNFADLFNLPSRIWSLGAGLTQPIFEGGLLRAGKNEAEAQYDAVVAEYRQTVLGSLQEVEDNLAALRILEDEAKTQEMTVHAAQDSADLAFNQYKAGTATYVNVATTQAALLNAQSNALNVRQRRFTANVLLIKALGGGWEASEMTQTASAK
ncbi:efflux transporter outer membrane subunit [Silvimonas soli]|uniref:efflux transporter outer membrane subunit n=1 Tax=Silvimonas soli TaxID=2980100 RepID=UPI0024B3446B|nr:efflux transporter outer membrane subunit [Silvimonas soli]